MKITVSNWLISTLNLYSYPVFAFVNMCAVGGCACGGLKLYLYKAYYNGANNTVNVIFIFDPATCNIGYSGSICAIARFDNSNNKVQISQTPAASNWCQYSVYEVISLIGAN